MDDSAPMCDEVIESYNDKTSFNGKKATCKAQNFYILLDCNSYTDKESLKIRKLKSNTVILYNSSNNILINT